jgi:hypothetical protein
MGIFSKALKAVAGPAGIIANPTIGLNALAGKKAAETLGLGFEDEQGAYATPEQVQAGLYRSFANDYESQMGLADKGVQTSGLTRDVYGEDGLQSRLAREGRELANNGFQLTQGDREAYGQVSGDVSRLFGQQEQQTSQNLARRGLASASSGASAAAFSGLQGSKNEMLAKAQTDIAQKRMTDAQNRYRENAALQAEVASVGAGLSRNRFLDKGQGLLNSVSVENAGNEARRQALADQEAAIRPGLFSTIGQGLQAGIGNLATQAPGMLVSGGMPGMSGGGGSSALGGKSNTFAGSSAPKPSTTLFGSSSARMTA